MTTIELLGWTVVHRNLTEYPLTGSKVLLTVAETLLAMISPELTLANSGAENTPARMRYSNAGISFCRRKATMQNQRVTVFLDFMKISCAYANKLCSPPLGLHRTDRSE